MSERGDPLGLNQKLSDIQDWNDMLSELKRIDEELRDEHETRMQKEKHFHQMLEADADYEIPAMRRSFQETCEYHGYTYEEHTIRTEDGYHLTLFRITGKEQGGPQRLIKPPLFFQHGILDSADAWIQH